MANKVGWVEEWDLISRGALVGLAPWHADSMDPADVRCLPLRPMFPGMVVDVLLFATAWLIAFSGIHAFARWRAAARRRAHLCPRCAYRLEPSESERCPECGAEATHRPPLMGPRRLAAAAIALLLLALALTGFALVFHARRPYPALHHAAYVGDVKAVGRLVSQGADIEGRMTYTLFSPTSASSFTGGFKSTGLRPLMLAAAAGDVPTVRCLLDAGAFVDTMDDMGLTALHYACGASNHAVIEELIARGADVNANAPNATPLWQAAFGGDIAVLEQLAEGGAEIVNDEPAFMVAVQMGRRPFVEELLERGAEITGLVMARAVRSTRMEMIDLLIEHGGSLRQRGGDGSTMLFHVPCDKEALPLWERIIDAGVDVNAVNKAGDTALIYQAGCMPELIEFLLDHGADPTMKNAAGETALDLAINEEVRALLRRAMEDSGERSDE
ncbi:MAG: ankyrin repeat domain-containing protein [Planctomycetota bacterium]|nr:ankyrin repeat domain-containing protein [Planctomycetota bacterium]